MDARSLLAVGGFRDDGLRSIADAARSTGINPVFLDRASELSSSLDDTDPLAVVLRLDAPGASQACMLLRSTARLTGVPVFGYSADRSDLAFVELFSWGGDDMVSLASDKLARRLRHLLTRPSATGQVPLLREGYAIVGGSDPRWRTLMARALLNGGHTVRFASNTADMLADLETAEVNLVVVADDLEPEGATKTAALARKSGSRVPWVIVAPPKRMGAARAEIAGLAKVTVTDAYAPPENVLFMANELGRDGLVDKRASPRVLYGASVEFRVAGRDEGETGFTYNVSTGGVYVRTFAPIESGQEVWIELWPPRSERRVRLAGKVAWRRLFGPNEMATVPPGFGVRITDGLAGDLERYQSGVRSFADMVLGDSD
jgi:DNA-binding response OmpR family regulator/Tfp pilus assembly protein PilZ